MTGLFESLFGSAAGFIQCGCGEVVENTTEARNAHICGARSAPNIQLVQTLTEDRVREIVREE